jgi:hypothetical protein
MKPYKVPQKKCRLRDDGPIRFSKAEMKKRNEFILGKGACQVCDQFSTLDIPHHAVYGLGVKDDRSLINICLDCHRKVHAFGGYSQLDKTREEIEAIGWNNNSEYEELS